MRTRKEERRAEHEARKALRSAFIKVRDDFTDKELFRNKFRELSKTLGRDEAMQEMISLVEKGEVV